MAKRTQRLIAILLTLALALSLLPTALATEGDTSAPPAASAGEQTEQGAEHQAAEETPPAEEPEAPAQDTSETEDDQDKGGSSSKSGSKSSSQSGGGSADSPTTYAASSSTPVSGKPGIKLTFHTGVAAGSVRFIPQVTSSPYFDDKDWTGFKAIQYCWAASMSMSLSYLGINKLPKEILSQSTSHAKAPSLNWGAQFVESSPSDLDKAVDNYVNGNGTYSPPVIQIYVKGCYSTTTTHFFVIVGKTGENTYLVTDPVDSGSNPVRTLTAKEGNILYGMKTSSGKKGPFNFKVQQVYQYLTPHETWLENGKLSFQDGLLPEKSGVAVKGKIGGSEQIASVTAGCYNLAGKAVSGCNETVQVNSVGCDLAELNSKLKFSQLTPGYYTYRVTVTMATGEKRVLQEQNFTVRYTKKSLDNATFYFDNGENIKLCTAAVNQRKASTLQLQQNIESDQMKIKAKSVGKNGYYTLQIEGTDQYLTVYQSSDKSGTKVIQYPMVSKDGQYWQILPSAKSGYYYLMPKSAPDCCLSVADNEIEAGSTLEIRTATADAAQSWLLRYTRPLISSVKNVSSGLQVTWKAPSYATGYYIYRAVSNSNSWAQVKKLTSGTTSSWTDTNVTNGTKYHYKVLAVYTTKKSPNCPQKHRYRVTVPGALTVKNSARKKLTVSWKVNKKATGYQVCYATNKKFSSNKVITVAGSGTKSKVLSGLTKGKTYYVKVRAYKTVGQDHYYSAWTSYKAVKVAK